MNSRRHLDKIRKRLDRIKADGNRLKAEKAAAIEAASRKVLSVSDAPDSDYVPARGPEPYRNLNNEEFILKMFQLYLNRKPESEELKRHIRSLAKLTRFEVNESFAYCDEVVRLAGAPVYNSSKKCNPETGDMRVAILLTGHLRTFQKTYPAIRENLVVPLSADVFVHTWNTLGLQKKDPLYGPVPDETLITDENDIRISMPEVRALKIEDNAQFLLRAKIKDKNPYVIGHKEYEEWIRLSAKPIFIESQLYSVHSAFQIMKEYEAQHNFKYDLVIKLRSDMEITSRLPQLGAIKDSDIWVANPPESGHDHPVCFACSHGPHEGLHATDVCDIYAYGSRLAMQEYCGLWNSLEKIYNRMCAENIKNVKSPDAYYGIRDGQVIFSLWSNGSSHKLHGFYPERMLRLLLEGFRLRPGGLQCKIIR